MEGRGVGQVKSLPIFIDIHASGQNKASCSICLEHKEDESARTKFKGARI